MTPVYIGHLDADCFYVSAERVRNPALKGKPVGVLGNQGAAVIAKSYELKAAGVTTGEPIWEAALKCPEAIYVKRDFRWYEVLSRQLLDLLRTISPCVEYYSIDEMFFSVDRSFFDEAKPLQARILSDIGIPVSIGVAKTKTLAKLLSDSSKPLGCRCEVDHAALEKLLGDLPVSEVSGIGNRSAAKLAEYDIRTCLEFAKSDRRLIRRLLTVTGERLWFELNGDPVIPILTQRPAHKILGRGGSLGEATLDRDRLMAWIARNLERLIEELDYHKVLVQRIILMLEIRGGGGWGRRSTVPAPTAAFRPLFATLEAMLSRAVLEFPVTGMEILADKLSRRDLVQTSFLDRLDPRDDLIAQVKQEINRDVGRFALRSGATTPLQRIYDDETNDYDICDVRGKICF